jgi:hypothetical protein
MRNQRNDASGDFITAAPLPPFGHLRLSFLTGAGIAAAGESGETMTKIISRTWLLGLITTLLSATITPAAEEAGVKLDNSISVNGSELVLNGAGSRTKLGAVKVYVAALYLPARSSDASGVINSTGPRTIRLVMKRDVDAKDMWDALKEGIEANTHDDDLKALQSKMATMEKAFRDMGKTIDGDALQFDFAADGATTFSANGKVKATVPGKDFASAFLKIWLGQKPAQGGLKKDLLKG